MAARCSAAWMLFGGMDEAAREVRVCAIAAGLGPRTQAHAVGDEAPWIADQVAEQFGTQGE